MKITIYHALTESTLGGRIEKVWGKKMLVKTIDSSHLDDVERHKADGWHHTPDAVINQKPLIDIGAFGQQQTLQGETVVHQDSNKNSVSKRRNKQ